MSLPKHIAIIMDGNGRWAQARNHHRIYGHLRGAKVARTIIETCANKGIENLTLFTFSTENWFRPEIEVSFLMKILVRYLRKEKATLIRNNIKFRTIGNFDRLPEEAKKVIRETIAETSHLTGMELVFALSYGGRQELCETFKVLAEKVKDGQLDPQDIDEAMVARSLPSSFLPDPDLIIRTSGEYRLSNFFLWQSAYSELFVTPTLWPNFTIENLEEALDFFGSRERRFGRVVEKKDSSSQPAIRWLPEMVK